MDAQFWIYIVIGVIYFLSRLLKKPEEAQGEVPDAQPRERRPMREAIPTRDTTPPPGGSPRPMTFEELLREITEGKQAPARREPEPEVVPQYEAYERELGDEAKSLEDTSIDEAKSARRWKPYEEVPVQTERRSLEETLKLEDTVVDFRKFEAFEQKDKKRALDEYIKLIRNPHTLRQAVVMSEILKRKF